MQLKLEELQRVAKRTIREERRHNIIRDELCRVFGPAVVVSKHCEKVAEVVNEQLDVIDLVEGKCFYGEIKTSVLLEAAESSSAEVRKVAARLLPTKLARKLLEDTDSSVRCAVAKRLPYVQIKETAKSHPNDHQLKMILREKRISEASGLPTPKIEDSPLDIYGEPLGDAGKQDPGEEPSKWWYENLARKICKEYGGNIEGQWEETIATRIVSSNYATSGIKLDRDMLLQAIYDCIEEREDEVVKEGSLRSIAARLMREARMEDSVMPIVEERNDLMADLLESSFSDADYVDSAEKLFSVRKSTIPAGIKKYRIGEGRITETMIPVKCRIPAGHQFNSTAEKALDRYVESWNSRQEINGEPYRISWENHPEDASTVSFRMELK